MGYISVVLKNIVRYNARKNRVVICTLEDVIIADSSSIDRVEESFDRKIRCDAFQTLWQEIDEDTREILSRKYVHEEADASIAQSLGISENSVRTYLSRAKCSARERLEGHRNKLLPDK
jgi:RNA polymerase sigma factor (sigma-70 family)